MPSLKRKFGDMGEKEAEAFLVGNGYKILERNFRIKNLGELDIVAEKNGKLIFFEVKTRDAKHESSFPIGFSINERKRKNLKRIGQLYLIERNIPQDLDWQVDAIFVLVDLERDSYRIEQLKNILWEKYY